MEKISLLTGKFSTAAGIFLLTFVASFAVFYLLEIELLFSSGRDKFLLTESASLDEESKETKKIEAELLLKEPQINIADFEEQRPLKEIPTLDLLTLFYPTQRDELQVEIDQYRKDLNAVYKIISFRKIGMNPNPTSDSEFQHLWQKPISEVQADAAIIKDLLNRYLKFQKQLQSAKTIKFISNRYSFNEILLEAFLRESPLDSPQTEKKLLFLLLQKLKIEKK